MWLAAADRVIARSEGRQGWGNEQVESAGHLAEARRNHRSKALTGESLRTDPERSPARVDFGAGFLAGPVRLLFSMGWIFSMLHATWRRTLRGLEEGEGLRGLEQ